MQQAIVAAVKVLETQAKLTSGPQQAANARTLVATGAIDVAAANNVYLNLDEARVASVMRDGQDLVLVDIDGQVLRLQGFYEGAVDRRLFLEGDDDRVVLLETQAVSDGPIALTFAQSVELSPFESETRAEDTAAGTVGLGSGGIVAAGVGLLGLVGAALGGGGGSGGDSGPFTTPTPPADTTAPAAPANLSFNASGERVSGTGEPGARVTIRNTAGGVIGTGVVGSDGTFVVTLTQPQIDRETISVDLTDAAGNVSGPGTAQAPDLTPPAVAAGVSVAADGGSVTGTGEAGSTVTVRGPGGAVIGTGVVGANGTFVVQLTQPLIDRESVSVVLTDAAGNASGPATAQAPDLTAPSAPTGLTVTAAGGNVTGTGEAGAAVTVRSPAGVVLGTGVVGADGTFNVALQPALTNGEAVVAVLTDAAGNTSPPATASAPDTTAPVAPTDVVISTDGAVVTGTGEPGTTVTVRGPRGDVVGTGTVRPDGGFTVPLQPQTNGETVTVVLTDTAGNTSGSAEVTAPDLTAPTAPTDVQISADGATLVGQGEAGAVVTVRGPDGVVIGSGVVRPDGGFNIALTQPLTASETITAVQADAAGNVSPPATATAPDLVSPGGANGTDAPTVIIGEAAGGVNAVELSDGIQTRVLLTSGAQAGDRVTLTVTSGGAPLVVTYILTPGNILAGVAEVVLPSTLADGSYAVVAVIDDGRGASSAASAAVNLLVDTVTATPVVTSANGQGLTGTAEVGATVTLLDGAGTPVLGAGGAAVTAVVGANGVWTLPGTAVTGGLNGFTGSVRATDPAGNTAQASVGPVDGTTSAPVITAQNGLGVEGTAEAGATISLLDAAGNPVIGVGGTPITAVVDGAGNWSIPATAFAQDIDGFTGSVRAVDPAGNAAVSPVGPIDGSVNVSLNIDSVTADNVINIAEAGAASVPVTGRALGEFTAGQTITVTLSNGAAQTAILAADGRWSVSFAGADLAASSSLTATTTTTDEGGNTVTVTDTQAYARDLLAPLAPIITSANGAGVSGTGEAGMVLNLLNASGTVIATTVIGMDGRWTIPASAVPMALDGFIGSAQELDAAGNDSSTALGPIDGTTVAPTIVSANGAGLTGTAEAGTVVTLVNGDGTPVLNANGTPVTTIAGPTGAWSLPGGAIPGGLDGFSGTVRAVDNAGNAATSPVGPIDGLTPAPIIIGANAGGITGLAEPGAVILLNASGVPVVGTDGQPIRVVVAADGSFNIPSSSVPGGLDGFTGSVRAVDVAGNASATAVGPIDGAVTVSLTVDAVTADNVINLVESQGTVTLTGRAVGEFSAGQTVTLTLSNGQTATALLSADGQWSVSVSGADLAASTSVTAVTTTVDTAGNTVEVRDTQAYSVDLSVQAPVIVGANGQALSGTAEAGVIVALISAAGTVIATTTANSTGAWQFAAGLVAGGLDGFGGSVRATDAAGNTASTTVSAVDGSTPVPVVTSANGQGLTGTAEVGATVTLLNGAGTPVLGAGGAAVTAVVGMDGTWSLPGAAVTGGLNGFTGSVRATDPAGNTAQASVGPVDGATSAPVITAQNGLGVEGTAEAGATISLLDAAGNPVIGVGGTPITAVVDGAGNWSIPATAFAQDIDGFTGSVRAVDPAGNAAVSPVGPIDGSVNVSLNIDSVTADNVINIAEAGAASVPVTGRAVGDFAAGQTITVTLSNGAAQTAILAADGRWSVSFAGADLAASSSLTATTTTTDESGNSVTVTDTQAYARDLVAPLAPIITSANGAGVSGTGEAGSVISLVGPAGVVASAIVAADGTWSVPGSAVPGGLNGLAGTARATDAAGNSATSALGPIDGVTAAPVVSAANGASVTGTGEVGATITLINANGSPLLGAGGAPVTALVNGVGIWTIPGSAVPGGLDGFSGTARAIDVAGNTATGAVGPIDGRTPAPVISAANGSGLFGTAEAGAVVALVDASGNPRLNGSGVPITTVVGSDGTWSLPASVIPGGVDGLSGSVVATDQAGNTASTVFGPVDGAADASLRVDSVATDNVVNGAEAGQASVTVQGRAFGDLQVGDTVRVELSTGVFRTVTIGAGGVWSASFSGAELAAGTTVTASAVATDDAGNNVTISDVRVYVVDLVTAAPVIQVANGTGLSGTAEAGATVTVRNASGQAVGSAVADNNGAWTIAAANLSAALDGFSGSIQAVDAAGNTAASPVGPVDGALRLTLAINPVTPDNVVNIAEAAGAAVAVSGSVSGEYRVGDVLTVRLSNGASQTVVLSGGTWTVSFAGADLSASTSVTASVSTVDAAGNAATVAIDRSYGVDVVAPTVPIVTSAGVAGLAGTGEAGAVIQLRDSAGTPLIGSSGQPVVATVGLGGTWTIPAAAFAGAAVPANFTGQVTAVDAAGNVSGPTVIAPIDVTPPSNATTTVTIDVIAGDDIVNLTESRGSVTVTGQVTGEFHAGDAIVINSGAQTFTGTVAADGRWSVDTAGSALTGGTLTATVSASDAAGNVGTITGSRPYGLDLVSPGGLDGTQAPGLLITDAADGLVTPLELADGVSATVSLTPTTQIGDTVVVTLTTGGVVQTFSAVVTAPMLAAGQVSIPIGTGLAEGQYSASARITDTAGNASAPSTLLTFAVDAVALGLGAASAALSEAALGVSATGSLAVTGASGVASYALQAPAGSFTSMGRAVTWAVDGTGTLIGSAAGQPIVRATISVSGQYNVTLLGPLDHSGANGVTLQLPIGVTVTDAYGSVQGVLAVGVLDGVPVMAPTTALAPTSPGVIVGDFVPNFGADGGALTSVTIDGRTFTYNPGTGAVVASGSSTTLLGYSVQNGVLSATTVRGEAISVNFTNGDYRVEVSGQDASTTVSVKPDVALGGGRGLLGLIDANVLGLIALDRQQFFSASDANNDIGQVVIRYSALLSTKNFSYNSTLATELGLVVAADNRLGSSEITITAAGGGAVDNLKLNEFLGSITFDGGLAALLGLAIAQTLSIAATDLAGNVTTAVEGTLADLGVAAGLLGAAQPAQILTGTSGDNTITASDVGSGAALDNRLYGYAGNDTLNAGLGNDILRGGAGNDTLNGGAGNDLLIGGTGNDTMTGGTGLDVFRFERGDQGIVGAPAADIITDFSVASLALGGDVLDLSSLLIGEGRIGNNPGNLTNFIHFEQTGAGTLIHISTTGGFIGGYGSATSTGGGGDQTILLSNVDLTAGFGSDQAILADLLARGKLVVDTLNLNGSTAPNTLVIGATATDGDGDTASTTLTIDSTNVAPAAGANVAPVVEGSAQALLGILGLGALGLNLNQQDLLAADADGNLRRVEVEYAPLVAVNLTPLTFGYSAALALSYGLNVQVTQSQGLLGIVAPSARLIVTALDGGNVDNVQINQFLESVYLANTGGGLLTSNLLSVGLLNALSITATDAQGLSSSAVLGTLLNVNALNSLDGPDPVNALAAVSDDQSVSTHSSPAGPQTFPSDPGDGPFAKGAYGYDDALTFPQEGGAHTSAKPMPGVDDPLVLPGIEDTISLREAGHDAWTSQPRTGNFQMDLHDPQTIDVPQEDRTYMDHGNTFAGEVDHTGMATGLAHEMGSVSLPGGADVVAELTQAILDDRDVMLTLHDSTDTLNQPILTDAAAYDLYVAPLPLFDEQGAAQHP